MQSLVPNSHFRFLKTPDYALLQPAQAHSLLNFRRLLVSPQRTSPLVCCCVGAARLFSTSLPPKIASPQVCCSSRLNSGKSSPFTSFWRSPKSLVSVSFVSATYEKMTTKAFQIIPPPSSFNEAPVKPRGGRTKRVYRCQHCGRIFKRSEHCARHERVHTNERPFQCGFCDRKYARKWVSLFGRNSIGLTMSKGIWSRDMNGLCMPMHIGLRIQLRFGIRVKYLNQQPLSTRRHPSRRDIAALNVYQLVQILTRETATAKNRH